MCKKISKILRIIVSISMILSISLTTVNAEGYPSYQERKGEQKNYMVKQKAVYVTDSVVTGSGLKIGEFSGLKDMCKQGNLIYILDSANARIVVLNEDYTFNKVIDNVLYNNEQIDLTQTDGLFVSESGEMYIADSINCRVLIIDKSYNVIAEIQKPDSPIIPESLEFKAKKVLVDRDGYLFVLCEGVYYGAMVFDKQLKFCGFFGANQTTANILDTIKSVFTGIFQTDEKRQYSLRTLPYEFDDLFENNGFIYTVTRNSKSGKGQIRKLSNSGINILHYNETSGDDFTFGNGKDVTLIDKTIVTEEFSSVAVGDTGYIYALDSTYGRVFVYDDECNLVTAFGGGMGLGKQVDSFVNATEIIINNNDVMVMDSDKNSIAVFKITDYGNLYFNAITVEKSGEYEQAFSLWKAVLSEDAYNQRAYSGIANYYASIGEHNTAIKYAKKGLDKEIYNQSFEEIRREFLASNFIWITLIIVVLVAAAILLYFFKFKKRSKDVKKEKGYFLRAVTFFLHPIESSLCIKKIRLDKKQMNIYTIIAIGIAFLMFIFQVLESTSGGFLFSSFDPEKFNSFLVLISTVGILALWCAVNWGLCTLFEGKGTLKEIIIVTGFSMVPRIIYSIFFIVASHCLVLSESSIITGFNVIMWLVTIVVLLVALSNIHDYSFFRAIGMSLVTIVGMCLAAFLILLVLTLFQDLIGFVRTVVEEVIYRGN